MHGNLLEGMINKSNSIANPVTAVTTMEYFIGKAVEFNGFSEFRKDLPKFADKTNINKKQSLAADIRSFKC